MATRMPEPAEAITYVPFGGTYRYVDDLVLLSPRLDSEVEIAFRRADALELGDDQIGVRLGARAVRIEISEHSPYRQLEPRKSSQGERECAGSDTRCFDQLEMCCHNDRVIGNCAGEWDCP